MNINVSRRCNFDQLIGEGSEIYCSSARPPLAPYIAEFVVEGFFFLKVVTFLATLTANYGPLLH